MIRVMRNIGVRLWLTILVAVPACFYLMPWFTRSWGGPGRMLFFFCFSVICYGAISALMHLAGALMVRKRIHEAHAWERVGIPSRAEKKYLQAVRIYDSFLPFPFRSGKMKALITRSLARFALTFDKKYDQFKQAVRVYLASEPHDDGLAAMWLRQMGRDKTVTTQDQALLTRLAQSHYGNPALLPLLTRIFLDTGRMDFTARQVYAQVMEDPGQKHRFHKDISLLTGTPLGTAAPFSKESKELSQGDWTDRPGAEKRRHSPAQGARLPEKIRKVVSGARTSIVPAWQAMVSVAGWLKTGPGRQSRWRFYVKTGIMGGVCVGMVVFIYHTISYLKTPEPVPVTKTEIVIQESVPKPFTIQVAAYLTDIHARQYVTLLTEQGVDARIKKTTGGGNTWYLIQVSEFEDRKTATAYGNHLKSETIIEEFFVSNKE